MKKSILFMLLALTSQSVLAFTCYLEKVLIIPDALTLDDDDIKLKKRLKVENWHQCYMKAREMTHLLSDTEQKGFIYKDRQIAPMKAFAAIYWNFDQKMFMHEGKIYPIEGFVNRYALSFDNDGKDGGPWNMVMDPVGKRISGFMSAPEEFKKH